MALSQSIGCFIGGMGIEMGGGSIEPVCFSFSRTGFFSASLLLLQMLLMLSSTIIEGSVRPIPTHALSD